MLKGSKVRFIASATIGYDHIDTDWCAANNIRWTNAEGCNSASVAQFITAALVHLARKYHFRFEDRTLVVIGVGNVGRKVVKVAEGLGMRVVINDPPLVKSAGLCGFVSLDGLLREADIITLHVPLTFTGEDRTFYIADEKFFSKVNNGSFFFNSSRGEVCSTEALKSALQKGSIKDAVCDVWENEPIIDKSLLNKIAIGTPHIAGYSMDGKAKGTEMVVKNLARFFGIPELLNWKPAAIPSPEPSTITLDNTRLSFQETISKAIESTYSIQQDDNNLRINPSDFEKLRGDYPFRREFHAYSVKLKKEDEKLTDSLKRLGFQVYY